MVFYCQEEKLQQKVISLQEEAELLRSQILTITQEKLGHTQEVTELCRRLRDADSKVSPPAADGFVVFQTCLLVMTIKALQVEQLQANVIRLMEEEEETNRLRVQNQDLQQQVAQGAAERVGLHQPGVDWHAGQPGKSPVVVG